MRENGEKCGIAIDERSRAAVTQNFRSVFITSLLIAVGTFLFAGTAAAQSGDALAKDVRTLTKQAQKLTRNEALPAAEKTLRSAVALDANRSDTKLDLAYVLLKQRKLGEAYELSYNICKTEPKNAHAFAVLGNVLLTAGRFQEARPVLYTALKLDRGDDFGWFGLGMLEFYENNIDVSLVDLAEAVSLRSNVPDYWFSYAQVSARAEKYRQAADNYVQFLNVSSSADSERRARIKGLIQFLRFIGLKDRLYTSSGEAQTTVSFDLVGNRPIIEVKINKFQQPLRFVLDTGSGITVISEDTANRLKIKPINRGGYARGLGGDGKFEIVYGYLQSIGIGDVTIRDVPVYIRKFHNDQNEVDGYIGLAVISKFLATIDYGNKTFALLKKDDPRNDVERSSLSLPLRLTSSGFLSGQVLIEGIETSLNFIVDTGASVSVISDRVANTDPISGFENEEKLRVIGSAGITDDVPTFLLPRITFGTHTRKQLTAIALNLDMINEASGFEQAGILGGNFLRNYRLTFDFKNSRVNFTAIVPEND